MRKRVASGGLPHLLRGNVKFLRLADLEAFLTNAPVRTAEPSTPPATARQARRAERMRRAVALRQQGWTLRAIGDELRLSKTQVIADLRAAAATPGPASAGGGKKGDRRGG